jgi:hypothetical protein
MKPALAAVCLTVWALALVSAQSPPAADESIGTISDFVPGSSIVLRTDAGETLRYSFAKSVAIVNANGKEIPIYKLKRGRKVRVHYSKAGTDLAVDRVALVQE